MTDPHQLLGPQDVPSHLAEHHARQAGQLADVTRADLADYRSNVDTRDEDEDTVRSMIVHERLHARFGDRH
jgi:hypothetical protein